MDSVVEWVIQDGIRWLGVVVLKVMTFGRYRSAESRLLIEGGTGLVFIAAVTWVLYRWIF